MADAHDDAHARPPQAMRDVYKRLHKAKSAALDGEVGRDEKTVKQNGSSACTMSSPLVSHKVIFEQFIGHHDCEASAQYAEPETCEVPGLVIYRSLLPPEVQLLLLDKIFHRDLNNAEHLTNVHLHYDVPYPPENTSYFDVLAADLHFRPQDPSVHKAFTTRQYLSKKLRWMTLGGQYDWTNKVYPSGPPPPFPADMAKLIGNLFDMTPEAAIVNLYSPGDTLSLHRDVSEKCDRPLASISLGCDGVFLVGLDAEADADEPRMATLRLRSGDAVVMTGDSRYAWHGVPKVIKGTCPEWMENWPCIGDDVERFKEWKGWMKGKRINLNVRQMFA